MSVRQLQIANDSVQDRLLMRIATDDDEEIRVFLTRRFLREIWPHLSRLLAGQLANAQAPEGDAVDAHEASNFAQPFREENPVFPLGAKPLLASEATFESGEDGLSRMILREGRERYFSLNLNGELLQALCAMLRAASEQAKWDLALDYASPTTLAASSPGKSLLH